jgi:hypothetical protein
MRVCQVQEAALVALQEFIGAADEAIVPFIPDILHVFSVGFTKYQARNLHVLYDAVGRLSGASPAPRLSVARAPWGLPKCS